MIKKTVVLLLCSFPTFCYADGQDGLGTFVLGLLLFTFLFFLALLLLVYVVISAIYNELKFKLSLWITLALGFFICLFFNSLLFDLIAKITTVFFT